MGYRITAAIAACLLAGVPLAAQAQQKPAIHGLVTMGRLGFINDPSASPDNTLKEANAHPGIYAGAVILGTWSQLEPADGQFDFTAIDQGLAAIRAYNARHPATPLAGKLRVFAGPNAPAWAMALDGGPMTVQLHNRSLTLGHFWSAPYRAAFARLQQALAARYDTDPLLEEVAISSCASGTAEPFALPFSPDNNPVLQNAGYTDQAMQDCLTGALTDYAAWQHVALDYTFNPYRVLQDGQARPDPGFTEQVMRQFRQQLGSRAVLANHGLTPTINPPAQGIIDTMRQLGGPIAFQTREPRQDWDATVQTGEQVGMTELEVWDTTDAGGPADVTADQLHQYSADLHAR